MKNRKILFAGSIYRIFAALCVTMCSIGAYAQHAPIGVSSPKNYVVLKETSVPLDHKVTQNSTVRCKFRIDVLGDGMIPVFGSCQTAKGYNYVDDAFGLMVDGKTRRFVFATGSEFCTETPEGLVQVGKTYIVTLSRGMMRVDTTENASKDFYHKEIAVFQFKCSDSKLHIGKVGNLTGTDVNHAISIYDFSYSEGDEMKCRLILAKFQSAYCFFDTKKEGYLLDATQKVFNTDGGNIRTCTEHHASVYPKDMKSAMCVVCGKATPIRYYMSNINSSLKN